MPTLTSICDAGAAFGHGVRWAVVLVQTGMALTQSYSELEAALGHAQSCCGWKCTLP